METKRFVGGSVNMILTRQTCGQRSSRAVESKHQTLENYFYERICYMFLISKCRGDWYLVPCTFRVLAKREPLHKGDFRISPAEKIRIWHCTADFLLQVPKKCKDLDISLLYILILGTYSKFAHKNNFLALGVCILQVARALAAGLLRQDHVCRTTDESFRFHNKKFDQMRCKLDSTENPNCVITLRAFSASIKSLDGRGCTGTNIFTIYRVIMTFLSQVYVHVADIIFHVLTLGSLARQVKETLCACIVLLAITCPCGL